MDLQRLSKFISYVLRHHPEALNIELDEHGWAKVDELVKEIAENKEAGFTKDILQEIVSKDAKGRYSFNEDMSLIRANQGHSIRVDVELEKRTPPDVLYHGTATRFEQAIDANGLKPMSRLYVHLSGDYETAVNVGKRHGKPVVYKVNCEKMVEDGYEFFLSKNGVWLVESVPPCYLFKELSSGVR